MFFDYRLICTFFGCTKPVVNLLVEMCPECVYKVVNFEEELDLWLSKNYPQYTLDDVVGWYCKCSSLACQRDCLQDTAFIESCFCCPCNLKLDYIVSRIDSKEMPTAQWMSKLNLFHLEN